MNFESQPKILVGETKYLTPTSVRLQNNTICHNEVWVIFDSTKTVPEFVSNEHLCVILVYFVF